MKTKCPHCGSVRKQSSRQGYDAFWCGTYAIQGTKAANQSQHCEDLVEIFRLTEELNAWKAAAIALRDEFTPNTIEHPAVALYEAAAEKYGI